MKKRHNVLRIFLIVHIILSCIISPLEVNAVSSKSTSVGITLENSDDGIIPPKSSGDSKSPLPQLGELLGSFIICMVGFCILIIFIGILNLKKVYSG